MGQRFAVLASKIPNFATTDLKNDMMRLRFTGQTIPLLNLLQSIDSLNDIF